MNRARWAVLPALVIVLAGLQHFGLDRRPETREEDRLRRLGNLPAGDMVPTYIASLFFGAFRAAAIDVLWIQLRRVEEDRRWYERREILKMISYFQPRNPEVWSHLGWHSAYNVANGITDPGKSWEWIRFGLTWLRRGTRMLPDHPHLMLELAYTLHHKPSWRESQLDLGFLKRIESDAELQADLRPDGVPDPGRPLSAFELAILWLERSRDVLLKAGRESIRTQMGLLLYPSTMDGFIRRCLYLQAVYDWRRGRIREALAGIRAAEAHCRLVMTPGRYLEPVSGIFLEWAGYYAALPAIIEAVERAKSGDPGHEREALRLMQENILPQLYPLDEGILWSRYNPDALLNALKRRLSGGLDENECNDSSLTSTDLPPGTNVAANLAPEGLDVDHYWLLAPAPAGAPPEQEPPSPIRVTLTVSRPESARMDLKITVLGTDRKSVIRTEELRGRAKKTDFTLPRYGTYTIRVEALDAKSPWPADTRYNLQYDLP